MRSYYYLSNPYNGSYDDKELRARIAAQVCGFLLRRNIHAWSPIVHNHAMLKTVEFTLEERRSLILDFDFSLLRHAEAMIIIMMDGWKKSFGVGAEIDLCKQLSIPIKYLDPKDINDSVEDVCSLLREKS